MKAVSVVYGEIDPTQWGKCARCHGEGRVETVWRDGIFQNCPYCGGSGVDPHPHSYGYLAADDVEVGDILRCPSFLGAKDATVVKMGTDYDGPLRRANRRPRVDNQSQ